MSLSIASLHPGATEMLFALGLGDQVVAVSHECDYPPPANQLPRVLRSAIQTATLSSEAIDGAVRGAVASGAPLYELNLQALAVLKPDLVVTQSVCSVCSITAESVQRQLQSLTPLPRIFSFHAHTWDGVWQDFRQLARAVGCERQAGGLLTQWQSRLNVFAARPARPTVACIEWLDPLMNCGHWVPEMVALAGGREVLGEAGAPSLRFDSRRLLQADPDVLILAPCGFSVKQTLAELAVLTRLTEWPQLRAVRNRRVYAIDGNQFIQRAGPRLIDGVEQIAGCLFQRRLPITLP